MNCRSGCPAATDSVDSRCDKVDRRWFQCPAASVAATQKPTSSDNRDLYASERVVVMFVQLKNYLGSYWLAPWFFVYIYPSILVYESHGFVGPFVYCNIIQILFFIAFEFWDDSFRWTPLHDSVRTYSSEILGVQYITKSVDELILFCLWVFSWAAVPSICFINGHIFELPVDRIERLTSYVSLMTVTFVTAYIIVLLWIDMNLLEVKLSIRKNNVNTNVFVPESELTNEIIEPDDIPDLETVYEDISITSEFKIDNILPEFSDVVNEKNMKTEEPYSHVKLEQGEEAKEQEMDAISLSSSTLSDFDVITEEEINLLK